MSFDIMPYVVIEMQTVKTCPLSLSKRGISAYLMCCASCFPITSFGVLILAVFLTIILTLFYDSCGSVRI